MWRNVSVLEGELVAARYCAKGTICNDHRSLQIQLGIWGGHCEPPAGPGQRPGGGPGGEALGSSEDTSFYSTKNRPKIDVFLPGYCSAGIIRIGRQKISQKITFIFYKKEGVRNS